MPQTLTQKILAHAAGVDTVRAGELILAKLDRVLANDITAPVAIDEFNKIGAAKVFDESKISLVMDHFAPNKDIKAATNCKTCRDFASHHAIPGFYEGGDMGVEHCLLPEQGIVTAGEVIIGADSHTCTYGAIGAFSTGVGSTDVAVGMATGKAWFKVPAAIRVNLHGKLSKYVSGKDVVLHLIGLIGVDGALYQSLEYYGDGIANLSMSDRLCICNMAIEAGAKNGIFPVDELTLEFLRAAGAAEPKVFTADPDAEYERTIDIDLSALTPTVAFPHLPENTRTFDQIGDIAIEQVVIGSCTNGRLEDFIAAAEIMRGRKVAKGVRVHIMPGTPKVFADCMDMGLMKVFMDAGCVICPPSCGPCLGGHLGVLAAGERAVATTNRNFVGRMGHVDSEVYLASPEVAAASAVAGKIADPRVVMG